MDNLIFETAKNGNITCKFVDEGKTRYLYSKYCPEKVTIKCRFDCENIVVLGLGLGYELKNIMDNFKGQIYVVEFEKKFVQEVKENKFTEGILNKENVHLYCGGEYIDIPELENYFVFYNEKPADLNRRFYYKVSNFLNKRNSNEIKKRIIVFDHVTISQDCISTFEKLGFDVVEVKSVKEFTRDEIFELINKVVPDFVFTVNFIALLSSICEKIGVTYVSWTVDIPDYSLYTKEVLNNVNYIFHFDIGIVKEIKSLGAKNVYYLPQAANVNRLDKISVSHDDINKYSCDISFLGSTIRKNEFNTISDELDHDTLVEIDNLFKLQEKCVAQDKMYKNLSNNVVNKVNAFFNNKYMCFMQDKRFVFFILSRKFDELQRKNMAEVLSENFSFKVYGDPLWKSIVKEFGTYMGNAEHFYEMPKVFKLSKINVNLIRSSFTSGLPMRAFDIMGSGGFMASNYKEDLKKFFSDGKDMVIYRDFKDLKDIVEYYLHHDKERIDIALSGYEKVKKHHNYECRIKEIIKTLEI